jgi:hypothetical protein
MFPFVNKFPQARLIKQIFHSNFHGIYEPSKLEMIATGTGQWLMLQSG